MFKSSVIEACDVCFRRQLETLRIDMFYSHTPQASRVIPTSSNSATAGGSSSSFPSLSSPPLASLLPQLKSLASALLPTEGVGYEVQDISSTTAIETLCLSILNSSSST